MSCKCLRCALEATFREWVQVAPDELVTSYEIGLAVGAFAQNSELRAAGGGPESLTQFLAGREEGAMLQLRLAEKEGRVRVVKISETKH